MIPWQSHQIVRKAVTAFHVINVVIVLVVLVSFLLKRERPRWPFLIPMYVYFVGSVLGMFASEAFAENLYTLAQDIYLYVWFALLCVLLDRKERIALLALTWALMLLVVVSSEGVVPGVTGSNRLEFTFRNPNRAAAYLTFSFFILYHPAIPWLLKLPLAFVTFTAVSTTGSSAGYIGLGMGIAASVGVFLYMSTPRHFRPLYPLGLIALALLAASSTWWVGKDMVSIVEEFTPSGADERVERSATTRQEIWSVGLETFKEHPLGIGPASFHKQIESGFGSKGTIELHSDFVAALVERGIVGFIGFLLLILWVVVAIIRLLNVTAEHGDRGDKVWSAGISGACAAYYFYSITHEALHHETFWLMLALLVSQLAIMIRQSRERLWMADEEPLEAFEGEAVLAGGGWRQRRGWRQSLSQ